MILMHGTSSGVIRGESAAFKSVKYHELNRAKSRRRVYKQSTKKQQKYPRHKEREEKFKSSCGKKVPKSWDNSGNGVIPDFSDAASEGTEEANTEEKGKENSLTDSDKRAVHLLTHRSLLSYQREQCSSVPQLKGLAYCRDCLIRKKKPDRSKLPALPPTGLSPLANPVGVGIDMQLYIREKGAVFSGLVSCDSQWCMNCVAKKKEKHVRMISRGIEGARLLGYGLYFMTLTVQRSDDIVDQRKQLEAGWNAVSEALRKYRKQGIKCEFVWALDVTFQNKNERLGVYHPHLHIVLAIESNPNVREVQRVVAGAWARHTTGISTERCQDVRRIYKNEGISRYIAKFQGMALELTNGTRKKGRTEGNMSLVGLMELGMNGSKEEKEWSRKTYIEFLLSMKKKRTLQPSQGWKDLEKIPAEEEKEEENIIEVRIPEIWHELMAEYNLDVAFVAWWNVHVVPNEKCLYDFDLLLEMHTYDWEYNTAHWKGPESHAKWWQRKYLERWIELYQPQHKEGSRLSVRLSKIIDQWNRRTKVSSYRSNIARRVIRKMKKDNPDLEVQQLRKLAVDRYPFPTKDDYFYHIWRDVLKEEGVCLQGHLDEKGVSMAEYRANFHAHAKQYKLFE
jgi:hypothetical protein